MESTKLSATFLLLTLLLSTLPTSLSCGSSCPGSGSSKPKPKPKPKHPHPPKTGPGPIVLPPIIGGSPLPVIGPIIGGGSPVPVIGKPPSNCPTTPTTPPVGPPATTCPIDSLKLGACVDLLGGLVHIGLGDPVANQCCPVIQGLVELEAAVCLCTTIKLKLLNINLYLPLALQLLLTCGKAPPPGYTCTI